MDQAPPEKVWFLYLMTDDRICRVDVDEFCKKSSAKLRPRFEMLYRTNHDGRKYHDKVKGIPRGKHIHMGSKVYIIEGSDNPVRFEAYDHHRNPEGVTHCFDPSDPKGPSLCQCQKNPIMRFREHMSPGFSIRIEDKVYVVEEMKQKTEELEQSSSSLSPFRVYDPLHQSWKALPDPPTTINAKQSTAFAVGHKLVVTGHKLPSYMFDTRREIWEDCPKRRDSSSISISNYLEDILNNEMEAFVEFEGFLIGKPLCNQTVAAYRWDSNGVPKLYRVLHELKGIFCPFLLKINYRMGKCDGGRIWMVYVGKDLMDSYYNRVAVFRVTITNDTDGNPILSAKLEAAEFFCFGDHFPTSTLAFALCHQPNGEDEKIWCGDLVEHTC